MGRRLRYRYHLFGWLVPAAIPGHDGTGVDHRWRVGNHPDRVSSLIFLDFSRLLTLGEQTGLGSSPAYQAAKGDLDKVRAIGAHTSGNDSESTAEISLLIP